MYLLMYDQVKETAMDNVRHVMDQFPLGNVKNTGSHYISYAIQSIIRFNRDSPSVIEKRTSEIVAITP